MTTVTQIPVTTIDGQPSSLDDFSGQVRLVVNVASKCGLTPQYEGLEKLYREKKDQGLVILGFPANDFAEQEPGTEEEIKTFCSTNYDVTFPMFSKVVATGDNKHPLYAALTNAQPTTHNDDSGMRENLQNYGITPTAAPEVLWNFEKFLVDRNGEVVARFAPDTSPDAPELVGAIDKALG